MFVYLALGTNQGERVAHLRRALIALHDVVAVRAASPVYETAPLYVTDQPRFLNMVIGGETPLTPVELLQALKGIEAEMGRDLSGKAQRYGPRPIDIDILLALEGPAPLRPVILETPTLTIPHPRLAERAFVLYPLRDVAPSLIHPLLNVPVTTLAERVAGQDIVRWGALENL